VKGVAGRAASNSKNHLLNFAVSKKRSALPALKPARHFVFDKAGILTELRFRRQGQSAVNHRYPGVKSSWRALPFFIHLHFEIVVYRPAWPLREEFR
jgi:hypothetical protein